ncbi:MAG: hypothetical protein ABR987_07000 [Terracidiphilus sp.]
MSILTRNSIPLILAVVYASIILCMLLRATFSTDEFGYRFIPVMVATSPLSHVVFQNSGNSVPILVGGAVNTLVLFGILKGAALLMASRAAK